jgi:4-hydroxybenzoate polyprenyltransferase
LIEALVVVWCFASFVVLAGLLALYPPVKRATWTYCVILMLSFGSYFASAWALGNEVTHGTVAIVTIEPHGAPK